MKEHEVDWTPLADIKPARVGRGYSTFSQEEGERIRQFWLDNQICALWIMRYFGLTQIKIIDNILHKRIKYERPAIRLVSEGRLKQAWLKHRDGTNLCDVAKELGTTPNALRSQFERRKWKIRRHQTLRQKIQPQVEEMTRAGMSLAQIAKALNVSTATVIACRLVTRQRIINSEMEITNGTDN